jgi:hypothetical protein
MAGGWTGSGAQLLLNRILRNTGTVPTTLYLGLATVAVTATDTLSTITEVATAGYARQAVTFAAASGTNPATVSNSGAVTFTFSADPPSVTYAFITDAASGTSGTIFYRWTGTAVDPGTGESIEVAIGALVVNELTTPA